MSTNPFSRGRYEHIPTHLYYLPDGVIQKLEDSKPSYVIGSRGSGKTTLLKSLHWKERLSNKWLGKELGGDFFRGCFVATYTKLPLVQINAFNHWLEGANNVQHDLLFGAYFDLISTENLIYSMNELASSEQFRFSVEQENVVVAKFLEKCEYIPAGGEAPSSLKSCHSLVKQRRRELESCAIAEASISETIKTWTLPAVGEITRTFCQEMANVVDPNDNGEQWHFKCCFDEAECLSQRQLVLVNSLVRTCEWPVSFVVSFVGQPADLSLTSFKELTNQQADLSIVYLDNLESREFQNLCDGVANIRIQASLGDSGCEELPIFKTEKTLGGLNMNELIGDMLKGSEGKFAKELKAITKEFQSTPWKDSFSDEKPAPYLQAYLADRLDLTPPLSLPKAKREQASREFRKKFVASFLSICRELDRRKIPFAFSNMVFGISDGCVRDYLAQMHHIFDGANLPLRKFIEGYVPWKIQDNAIRRASQEKRDSINTGEELSNPERVKRLTIALGELTAILQRERRAKQTIFVLRREACSTLANPWG